MTAKLLRERYEPLAVVGRGGEGEVIRALDHLHGRQIALKVRPVRCQASRVHLLSEARVLLGLAPHAGLPLVREDFFVDDRYVIAMDWIDGTDLEALLAAEGRPGLEPALVIDYLEQVAQALGHLHAHDPPVVHGDVKPANLIITASGRVVLVDFGLSSTPTHDERRAGTDGYVAPEVGAGARPTPAADIYSLAATALALLTGETVAGGTPSWGAIEPERIPALERIVRANLATDPGRRDVSATAFVDRLRRWWGADLPSGTVTLALVDANASAEGTVDAIAEAHGGCCTGRADDEPLLLAFASADDGVDAAREIASRIDARVGVVTGEAEPRAGGYRGEAAQGSVRLLGLADPGQVVIDDRTARAVIRVLPPDIGLAELPSAPLAAWAVVAPGLRIPPRAETCPYRGLMAFQAEDADLFFGRDEAVATTVSHCLSEGFIAVVGASGSGKSSVVRAGVVPALSRARGGSVAVLAPGADPETELRRWVEPCPPSILVVDQLEEAFTLCQDDTRRDRFFDTLLELHEARSTSIVVALRADFYGRCAEHPRLAAAVAAHQCLLGPMRTDALRSAIEGPARVAGLRLEAGLVDAMLTDVEGEPGALPLLSHALFESWARRDGQVLTLAGYRDAGGVRGAIARTADEIFVGSTEREQLFMRRLFLQLTELGETTEDTRRRAPLAELIPDGDDYGDASVVLERLTGSRLLVVSDDSAEIAHEALIREWPRLRGWLAEDRDALRALRELAAAARSWEDAGREEADLYRGPRLAAALELANEGPLPRVESEFLAAGRVAQDRESNSARRRAKRLRVLVAALAAALVAAVIAGSFALVQRSNARRTATVAQAGRLAAQSREVAEHHPDLGLLLALEADRLDDSVDSRGALLGALEHGSRVRSWLQGFDSPVLTSAFSPDGQTLVTLTLKEATLWDTTSWRPLGAPLRSPQGGLEWAAFSPDGHTLAIAGGKGRVELWDVATRRLRRELVDPAAAGAEPELAVVRFSPDGSVVAAGAKETNHVTVWEAASGRVVGHPITTHPPGSGGAHSISFSPDSRRIAVPGAPGTVGIWDVATGRRVGRPLATGTEDVEAAIFTADGRTLIASDDGGRITRVDVETGRPVGRPLSVGAQIAGSLDLSPDGRLLAAASYEGSVFVWDVKTGVPHGSALTADTSPVNDVEFSPDGHTLVSSHLGSAVVWNVSGEQAIGRPLGELTDLITDVSFAADGTRLVAGRYDGAVIVYDVATRRQERRFHGGSAVSGVAFHPDGRLVAAGTLDGKVRLLDRGTGQVVATLLDDRSTAVWDVSFSPDGRLLAVAVDPNGVAGFYGQQRHGEVQLWDVASRRRARDTLSPEAGSVLSVAFSADGALLATGSYFGQLDLWDTATGAHRGKAMKVSDDGVLGVSFDPNGTLVAGGGAIGPVRVWRVADQQPAFPPLSGHTAPVTATTFDAAGSFLATTSLDGETRLWEPQTGVPYGDRLVSSAKPDSVVPTIDLPFLGLRGAFSPDGKLLALPGIETRAMLWDVDPAVWRRRACAIAGRNLSREEWQLYLPSGTPYRPTCSEWPAN